MNRYEYSLINLQHIGVQNNSEIKKFLKFNGIEKFDNCDIESLKEITKYIKTENKKDFNVSYNVARLDKEFDLVKLGNDVLVNIELKLSNRDKKQCKENYKILKDYNDSQEILIFCYEKNENKIYLYNNEKNLLNETTFDFLNEKLSLIKFGKMLNINININSIYSNPDFYLEKRYDLSNSQSITKQKIINNNEKKITVVSGRAGTGKTLLALDLYDHYVQNNRVVYLTPFKLNDIVNKKLLEKVNMMTIKKLKENNEKYDIAICDEAQRISFGNIETLNNLILEKIVLIGDINQNIDSEGAFESLYTDRENNTIFNINQVIRTDDTFDLFARKILGISHSGIKNKKYNRSKIEIVMLDSNAFKDIQEYVFLKPSDSLHFRDCRDECDNKICSKFKTSSLAHGVPHTVISLEYDKVLLYFCEGYKILSNKIVDVKKVCSGNLDKQLYSLITRTISKLKIVTKDIEMFNFLNEKMDEIFK